MVKGRACLHVASYYAIIKGLWRCFRLCETAFTCLYNLAAAKDSLWWLHYPHMGRTSAGLLTAKVACWRQRTAAKKSWRQQHVRGTAMSPEAGCSKFGCCLCGHPQHACSVVQLGHEPHHHKRLTPSHQITATPVAPAPSAPAALMPQRVSNETYQCIKPWAR